MSCTVQGLVGVKKNHTKDNLGHASLDMVENYDHSLDNLRHEDIQKLVSKPNVAQLDLKKIIDKKNLH